MLHYQLKPYLLDHGLSMIDLLHTYRFELSNVVDKVYVELVNLQDLFHQGSHWHNFDD